MGFHMIDMDTWERREHYHYYRNIIKTRYNLNAEIDITNLLKQVKEKELRFYPVFVYILIRAVNDTKELRMSLDSDGHLGYWDLCHPSYTIFHDDDKTFSDIWTEYSEDFSVFYKRAVSDMEMYKNVKGIKAKPDTPPNFCPISCVPWLTFTGYGSDTYAESNMFYPVILFGKYHESDGRFLLPLGISVNHAVADGYHTCSFFQKVQSEASLITL
ncbi:chloramphenicol acetyltransferase [Clostridium sp. AM58-1XD]|uniref:chloramphenicol acetyltransferase n=1 Tax=Clostridium sp. AM58-1XD TaxID=2292307 RepID=UPI000E48080C|nr:chloramphenicol acetyltransferase [Clostridium sp. AM58-1XD]RGZ00887.1 chloramphenicol acetyltransferase CAT [Clostridium sp. AM58-1XD]